MCIPWGLRGRIAPQPPRPVVRARRLLLGLFFVFLSNCKALWAIWVGALEVSGIIIIDIVIVVIVIVIINIIIIISCLLVPSSI